MCLRISVPHLPLFLLLSLAWFFSPTPIYSQANNIPTVDSIIVAITSGGDLVSSVNLTENTTTMIYIRGAATDADSCQQIDAVSGTSQWKVVAYRTDVTGGQNCTADHLNCYQDTEQNANLTNCDNPGDTNLTYEMDIPIQYYADATDAGSMPDNSGTNWTAYVEVRDDAGDSANLSTTFEINTLKALDVSSTVNYGTVALAEASAERTITISNTGNDNDLDPLISDSTGWTCTIGSFTADKATFNTTTGLGWAAGLALTATPEDIFNLSVAKSTNGTNPTGTVYLYVKPPATGVGGTCTSTVTIGAN